MIKNTRPYRALRVAIAVLKVFPRYLWLAGLGELGRPATQERWDLTHGFAAREFRDLALSLSGAFTKAAQIAGARADVFPQAFIDELSQFHDAVPPRPFKALRPILRRELGCEPEAVFKEFSTDALAAASIAQVHRATLIEGQEVVVKIQYPEVRRIFPLDLSMLQAVAHLALLIQRHIDVRSIVREVVRFIQLELDFEREADSTERLGALLADHPDVRVPAVHRNLCHENVLVFEFLDGIQVTHAERLAKAGHKPVTIARKIGGLYGSMIFGLGFFHGDPHPGNLLVLPDGRIGLLDFGLCKELPDGFPANVAEMMISAMIGDGPGAQAAAERLGFESDGLRADHFRSMMLTMIGDSDGEDGALDLISQNRIRKVPEDFALVVRTLILLNGLSERLVPGPASAPGGVDPTPGDGSSGGLSACGRVSPQAAAAWPSDPPAAGSAGRKRNARLPRATAIEGHSRPRSLAGRRAPALLIRTREASRPRRHPTPPGRGAAGGASPGHGPVPGPARRWPSFPRDPLVPRPRDKPGAPRQAAPFAGLPRHPPRAVAGRPGPRHGSGALPDERGRPPPTTRSSSRSDQVVAPTDTSAASATARWVTAPGPPSDRRRRAARSRRWRVTLLRACWPFGSWWVRALDDIPNNCIKFVGDS